MERTCIAFRTVLATVLVLTVAAGPLAAQEAARTVDAADVSSIDAILAALYDVISGPAGEARDWDRFHTLFIPEGRLIVTGQSADGRRRYRVMTPAEYVETNGPGLTSVGFMEREIARTVEEFGNIAHAFSTYESEFTPEGQPRTARGINSIQMFHDGSRWWIVSVFWDSERPDNPIPAKYLPGGG